MALDCPSTYNGYLCTVDTDENPNHLVHTAHGIDDEVYARWIELEPEPFDDPLFDDPYPEPVVESLSEPDDEGGGWDSWDYDKGESRSDPE